MGFKKLTRIRGIVCGDLLVRGAVSLAKKLNIPALFIGLTIVAFGTSAPEFVVCIQAALASPEVIGIAVRPFSLVRHRIEAQPSGEITE